MGYVLASTGLLDRLSLESAVQSLPFDSVLSNATGGLTLPLGGNVFTGKQLVRLAVLYGVISVVMGWWVARRTVRPITRITESIQHIADASIRERINFEGPSDEIKSLADTFDTMLDRIESAQSGQRRFVANAAHELRTPLTVQRAILEVRRANPDTSTDAHVAEARAVFPETVALRDLDRLQIPRRRA